METVEAEACLREVFARPGDERLGHVHGDFPDLRRLHATIFEFTNERLKRRLVLARREEKQPRNLRRTFAPFGFPPVDLEECGAIAVAFAAGCLVHAEALESAPIGLFPSLFHPAADQMPDPVLTDFGLLAHFGYGHDFGEQEKVSLHEQGEAAAGPCPWKGGVLDRAIRRPDAWDTCPQGGGVLEEIEVLPGALHRIVNRAEFTGVRVGIGKAAAGDEVDDEFEGFCCGIEVGGDNLPWGDKAERLGENAFRGHAAEVTTTAGELPTRTRRSDEFQIPFSQRNLVDNSPANRCSSESPPTKISDVPMPLTSDENSVIDSRLTLDLVWRF